MAKPTSIKPGKRLSVSTVEARGSLKGSSRRGKYNAAGRRIDGAWFASEAEAVRYEQLRSLLADGVIERLELQPKFPILLNGVPITTYRADFRYAVLNERGGIDHVAVEDVKGMITDVYAIKKKLVEASYRITILEIPAGKIAQWQGRTA